MCVRIWEHVIFNELVTTPEVHNVLVTDASSQNRERMAQFFFEQCGCDCFQSALPAALVAHDSAAALVLDCGHGICSASPVHDRRVLRHQVCTCTCAPAPREGFSLLRGLLPGFSSGTCVLYM